MITKDIYINVCDVDSGEILFESKEFDSEIHQQNNMFIKRAIDSFFRGLSMDRNLNITITARKPNTFLEVIEQDLWQNVY